MNERLNILVLDDEPRVRNEIEEFLNRKDYRIYTAARPSEAFGIAEEENVDIVILDIKLPEMDGLQVLKKLKEKHTELEVIMISGHGDMNSVIEAMRLGAADFFQKPFRLFEINGSIERTKRYIRLQKKIKEIEQNFSLVSKDLKENIGHQLIGKSKAIKQVMELMSMVAKTDDTSILITGESGTGKELVARGIHYLSRRHKQYFHSVNCSAVPESLFESEFFGHKKGAFTGASEEKAGWFEIANKGTLFLDEISDMPMSQQAKLLRVLEEKKVSKVGTHQMTDVDVRVIAASNRNLEKFSNENKFRLDLYHRLSSFIIHIPPLRERKEDIPVLLDHFLETFSRKMGKPLQKPENGIYDYMMAYDYPGNIRELRNIVERALIVCEGNKLRTKHFQLITSQRPGTVAKDVPKEYFQGLNLEEAEKRLINRALKETGNNKSRAAELLGITWQSLDRRMKKFGLE